MPANNPIYLCWQDVIYWIGHVTRRKGSHHSRAHWETQYGWPEDPRLTHKEFIHMHPWEYVPIHLIPHSKVFLAVVKTTTRSMTFVHPWDLNSGFVTLHSSLLLTLQLNYFPLSLIQPLWLNYKPSAHNRLEEIPHFLLKLGIPEMPSVTPHHIFSLIVICNSCTTWILAWNL